MSGMILRVPSLFHPLADTQLFDDGQFFHVPFDDVIVDGLDNVVVRRDTLGPVYGNRLVHEIWFNTHRAIGYWIKSVG